MTIDQNRQNEIQTGSSKHVVEYEATPKVLGDIRARLLGMVESTGIRHDIGPHGGISKKVESSSELAGLLPALQQYEEEYRAALNKRSLFSRRPQHDVSVDANHTYVQRLFVGAPGNPNMFVGIQGTYYEGEVVIAGQKISLDDSFLLKLLYGWTNDGKDFNPSLTVQVDSFAENIVTTSSSQDQDVYKWFGLDAKEATPVDLVSALIDETNTFPAD